MLMAESVAADTGPAGPGEALYRRIKEEITALRLAPGTTVQEASLGERFGVSRTPAREVLHRLSRDGLVIRRGRFWCVIALTEREIRELCELREALECMAARMAARSDGIADLLTPMLDAQEQALANGDENAVETLDVLFHLRIAERAGNQELLRHLGMLHDRVALMRGMRRHRAHWGPRLLVEHRRIVDALGRGDAEIAAAEMRFHIRTVIAAQTTQAEI